MFFNARKYVEARLLEEGNIPLTSRFGTNKELLESSPQWRIRSGALPRDLKEAETAVLEALVIEGGYDVWPGDGVSIVAQMIMTLAQQIRDKSE